MGEKKVSLFYGHDNDKLNEYLRKFQSLKRKDYPQAKEFFKKFKFGLQRHIVWEEEILYPLFEKKTESRGHGSTEAMRQEHRLIKEKLEALHKKVQKSDPYSDHEENDLMNILKQHNRKEERILYSAIDARMSPEEQEDLFEKMQNVPEHKYKTCCQVSLD